MSPVRTYGLGTQPASLLVIQSCGKPCGRHLLYGSRIQSVEDQRAGKAGVSASSRPWTTAQSQLMQAFWGKEWSRHKAALSDLLQEDTEAHNLAWGKEPPRSSKTNKQRGWGCSSVVEHFPHIPQALGLILATINWIFYLQRTLLYCFIYIHYWERSS